MCSVTGMKLTLSTLACPNWTLEQIVTAVSQAGIGGIDFRGLGDEIDITKLPEFNQRLPATLELLARHGLQMPCLNTSITLLTPATERWQMMLEEAQRTARLAEKTRTRFMRVFGGSVPRDMSQQQALMLARRHLRQLIKIAATFGCMPIIETHDDWSGSAGMLELLREFDPAEVGVLWDIEHPFRRGEKPSETFQALKRFLRHVHVKDSLRVNNKNSPRLLGEGDLPVRQCVSELIAAGYDGWYCLETEKRWHAEAPEPEQSVPQFAQYMRSIAELSGR